MLSCSVVSDFLQTHCHCQGSGLPFPSPGDLPDPGTEPESPVLQADSLPSEPPGKSQDKTKPMENLFHM